MNKILTVLSLSMLAFSCGKKSSSTTTDATAWTTTNLSMNPVRLLKQDKFCSESVSAEDEISFIVQQFIDGEVVLNEVSFKNQLRGNYVQSLDTSRPISQTYYGIDTSITADITFDEADQEYKVTPGSKVDWLEVGVSTKLDICKETKNYKDTSYEASGLNISNSITQAYNAVTEALPGMYLKPISVQVAPISFTEVRYRGGPNDKVYIKGYSTDNAYYDSEALSITFLPQSKEYQEIVSKTPFWEIPMVGAHEYGHHVFQTLFLSKINSTIKHSRSCFQNHTTLKNAYLEVNTGDRENGIEFALGSMNEGFADLVSYYSIGEKQSSLKGIDCFAKNREIGSAYFASYENKTFNKKALELINSETTIKSDLSCDTPDFQEIHNVGAVFAYAANKLISDEDVTSKQKLTIILKWVKELEMKYESLKKLKAGEIFFASLELMKKISDEELSKEIKSECEAMNSFFPDDHGYKCRYLEN